MGNTFFLSLIYFRPAFKNCIYWALFFHYPFFIPSPPPPSLLPPSLPILWSCGLSSGYPLLCVFYPFLREYTLYLTFCVWVISLSIVFSSSINLPENFMMWFSLYRWIILPQCVRDHITPVRMTKIKNTEGNLCCRRCGIMWTFLQCWWEDNLIQSFWKSLWWFLRKSGINLPQDPLITHLSIYIKYTQSYPNNNHSTIFIAAYNKQNLETT